MCSSLVIRELFNNSLWALLDSNQRPLGYEPRALTNCAKCPYGGRDNLPLPPLKERRVKIYKQKKVRFEKFDRISLY